MKALPHLSFAASLAVLAVLTVTQPAFAQDRPGEADTPKPTLNATERNKTAAEKRPARVGSLLDIVRPDFSADGEDSQDGELPTAGEPVTTLRPAAPVDPDNGGGSSDAGRATDYNSSRSNKSYAAPADLDADGDDSDANANSPAERRAGSPD